ncbi:MAG: methylmalonyl-CoA mutase family protein [Bacteroidia bacterium]|nr:methylmalonyl-CoA mutase family protein [Bacteroidia bacterium]MDW8159656.1 methylmalonyl-CoA mutase family protein [Bacteroidia bacterium]
MFETFKPQDAQTWNQLLSQELKGKNPSLLNGKWETCIEYQPFYLQDSSIKTPAEPIFFPDYQVGSFYTATDLLTYPQLLNYALENDVQFVGIYINDPDNLFQLVESTSPLSNQYPRVLFYYSVPSLEIFENITQILESTESFSTPPVTLYEWLSVFFEKHTSNSIKNWYELKTTLTQKNFNCAEGIDLYAFDSYGAYSYQEIGFFQYYLYHFLYPLKSIPKRVYITISLSLNLNLQIAKLRAIRRVWNQFLSTNQIPSTELYIIGKTSKFYLSQLLEENNLIRNTISTLAGILGGCNTIAVTPHTFKKDKNIIHADRWARNIQHLLIHESGLTKVKDPLAGSYFIENLTQQIIENAEKWYKQLENKGGVFTETGLEFITQELLNAKQHRVELAISKELPIIGSNLYRMPQDPPLKELTHTEILMMLPYIQRIAELFEQ